MSRSWESSRGRHLPRRRRRTFHRRALRRLLVLGTVVAALAAGGATAAASGSVDSVRDAVSRNLAGAAGGIGELLSPTPEPPPVLSASPMSGARDVGPRDAARTEVTAGELRDVALRTTDGDAVTGTLSADRRSWQATEPLAYGSGYSWSGTWVRPDGSSVPLSGGFGTVAPARTMDATLNISDGDEVGVAAPIVIQFDGTLTDDAKANVERALRVRTSKPVDGAWAWLPDTADGSRVHYRPKQYWPSGTKVTVDAPLYGIDMGEAGYGSEDLHSTFTIGRSQIVKADTQSHQIVVIRDGKEVARYDASYGMESDPNRVTRSGVHVVMSKSQKVLMSNPAYGYINEPQYWAVRISNNGEFIHANPSSSSAQGSSNVSHGCVNLSKADGRAYFESAMFGDPVEVTGSSVDLSADDGDFYDWAIPWKEWQSMSALASRG